MVQLNNDYRDERKILREFSRTQSDTSISLEEPASDSVSSVSSRESLLQQRTRDRSRSRDVRELPKPQTTYSWRKNFQKHFGEGLETTKTVKETDLIKKKTGKFEHLHQSPSMNILQIKLLGESRLKPESLPSAAATLNTSKKRNEIVKSTCDVDVQEKREIFEGKDHEMPRFRKVKRQESFEAGRAKSAKENWNTLREKHCPITRTLVDENKGEGLRSSILCDKKVSFKNLKFTSSKQEEEKSCSDTKTDSITSTKEFEDTATAILNQMRKQRRTLQMEYVSKVDNILLDKVVSILLCLLHYFLLLVTSQQNQQMALPQLRQPKHLVRSKKNDSN